MSLIMDGVWEFVREQMVTIDDALHHLRGTLEEELKVLTKKEADKLRWFLKRIEPAEKSMSGPAWKLVLDKTGPAVPSWMEDMERRCREVSRRLKGI